MSRTKKSRKPGGAPTAKAKLSKVELSNIEKRVRKKTGKKPGNRQQEAQLDNNLEQKANLNKDPRIGSKKAIDLGAPVKPAKNEPVKAKVKTSKPKQDPIAALRSVNDDTDVELSLAQELANIEEDEQLQVILAKQEDGIDLTHEEVNYFNNMMERHEEISAELDDEEDEIINTSISSEEDLWDKLDNSTLPDSTK
ncbi:Der GTPase-activating protein YihI [Colwellia sp. 4_MG-2023]|uniref:Der GTPase-activating protein YihI n=1 Tax=unclassified Colwellia TaxID=196834 RepID=UPI0026E1590C|nr:MULTISPECIES: Der GTPase-activating protein YihI [unclassified Colwellia]MDO6488526.1 Der GTPase-activating protein YihI [Colwellia sp. 6_MG-2023]MDO6507387.1 Der GTPase-activating protein YihI [Colwellia sp. 5_MG-2023]MDO6556193.1 Der GTPase-activating protein YihI [Colwellia sp. 4_MG-2023]